MAYVWLWLSRKARFGVFAQLIVINLAYAVPDFEHIQPVQLRQQQFFDFLKPEIEKANRVILRDRHAVERVYRQWQSAHNHYLTPVNEKILHDISKKYKLNSLNFNSRRDWEALLTRVDIIPISMVLAQAANESGWGTSRFAKVGLNYFGLWCFKQGCGVIPKQRPSGKTYAVARFQSVYDSVVSYMSNLNTNSHYALFRQLRAHARTNRSHLSGLKLTQGLAKYSERGQAYVKSIEAIILHHRLTQYDIT